MHICRCSTSISLWYKTLITTKSPQKTYFLSRREYIPKIIIKWTRSVPKALVWKRILTDLIDKLPVALSFIYFLVGEGRLEITQFRIKSTIFFEWKIPQPPGFSLIGLLKWTQIYHFFFELTYLCVFWFCWWVIKCVIYSDNFD